MQTLIVEPFYPELLANRHALRVDFDRQVIDASDLCWPACCGRDREGRRSALLPGGGTDE